MGAVAATATLMVGATALVTTQLDGGSTSLTPAANVAAVVATGTVAPASVDLNGDGMVNALDLSILSSHFTQPAAQPTCLSLVRDVPPNYTPAAGHTPQNEQPYFSFEGPNLGSDDAAFVGIPTAYPEYATMIAQPEGKNRGIFVLCPDSYDDWVPTSTPTP